MNFESLGGRVCFVDVKVHGIAWRLVSAHLPHSEYSDLEYAVALGSVQDSLPRRRKEIRCVLGCDANAVVGTQNDYDDPRIVGDMASASATPEDLVLRHGLTRTDWL